MRRSISGFLVFVALATAVALAVAFVGQAVALERSGAESARAWRVGCGVSLVASVLSGLLIALSGTLRSQGVILALGSMLLRLVVVGLLGVAVAMLMAVEVRPFLLAVAISYLALLIVDTGYALYASGSLRKADSEASRGGRKGSRRSL